MIFKTPALLACTVLASLSFTSPSFADVAGEIKYRKFVMQSMHGHMEAIVGILRQETGNTDHMETHTKALMLLASSTGKLFPEGSDTGDTRALPAIWEKPQEFAAAVKALQDASWRMNEGAIANDVTTLGTALGALGLACENCHDKFRAKEKH